MEYNKVGNMNIIELDYKGNDQLNSIYWLN